MLLRIGVLVTALLGLAFAQSSTSTGTATAAGATHSIAVGDDGYNFYPSQVYAAVGDIIEYRFYPQNHSVARAAFKQPCIPYEDTGPNLVGFWSGFQPVQLVLSNPPIFHVQINDTQPVFFYCSAPGACFDGMVGVINPNATETFQIQFDYSQNATQAFSPGENYFPAETLNPTRTTTATGATMTPTPVSTSGSTTTPTSSSAPVVAQDSKKPLSTGGIVGIVIGGVVVLILAAVLIYMCGRQKTMGEMLRHSQGLTQAGHNSYVAASPGISEANYPNMQKPLVAGDINDLRGSGRFSAQGYAHGAPGTETESYRSMSPPIDERTGMMQHQMGNLGDPRYANGQPSPGMSSGHTASMPNSPGYPSPMYTETHEMEHGTGLRPFNPDENGPHEMAVPSRNPSAATPPISARPFSFTDSESGYRRDEKTGSPM